MNLKILAQTKLSHDLPMQIEYGETRGNIEITK